MRFLRSVRSLEWGLLAFAIFVVARAGPAVFLEWRELAGLRTVTVFCALGAVGAVRLAMTYRRLPWPVGTSAPRRVIGVLFPLALLPLVASAVMAAQARSLWVQVAELRVAQALPVLSTVLLRVVGFGLPTLVTWLALAVDVKRRGRIDSVAWLRADVPALLSTLRTWTPFLVVLSAYAWLDAAVGGKLGPDRDAWMAAADRAIFFGHDPLDLLERLISRPLSEWLAFAYSFYALLYPLVFGAIFLLHGNEIVRRVAWPTRAEVDAEQGCAAA